MRILAAFAAVLSVVLGADAYLASPISADSIFTPASGVRLCNTLPVPFTDETLNGNPACADVLTASAATDTSYQLDLYANYVNLEKNVVFVPGGATTAGGSIPAGTKLGGMRETLAYSLLNGTCSVLTTSDFIMFNVALPNNPGAPLSSTNLAYPQAQGTTDRFSKWKVGSEPGGADPSGIGLFDDGHADGTSVAFQNYPRYLLDAFGNLIPRAAYGGLTIIQGEWTPYFVLQFNAGQLATLPGAYSRMNSTMGAPLVWVRGDPTTTLPSPSSITDTCTPAFTTTMLLGRDQSLTYTRATTPAAGTVLYMQYLSSLRDTDQDGYENAIDTCPLNVDVGSPKTGGGDADGDAVDDSCDTAVTPFPNDTDLDTYINRLDNCPQTANATQAEAETANPPDLGPKRDQIGDPCEATAPPITITQNGSAVTITPSTTVANGRYHARTNTIPKCFGNTDADGDGYCATGGVATDNADWGTCAANLPVMSGTSTTVTSTTMTDSSVAWTPDALVGYVVQTGSTVYGRITSNTSTVATIVQWLTFAGTSAATPSPGGYIVHFNTCTVRHASFIVGTCASSPACQMDSDGDTVSPPPSVISHWSDAIETYLGTDQTKPCSHNNTADNEAPLDAWPLDVTDNRIANGADWLRVAGVINNAAAGGPGRAVNMGGNGDGTPTTPATVNALFMGTQSQARFDLNWDGQLVAGSDLGKFGAYMNKTCGVAGAPPTTVNNSGTYQQ